MARHVRSGYRWPLGLLFAGALALAGNGQPFPAYALRALDLPLEAAALQANGDPNTVYEIVSRHSSKCLAVQPSPNDGATAIQLACAAQGNQQWTLAPAGNGSYYLRVRHSGQCLSVFPSPDDGTPAVQWTCVAQNNQQWTLEPGTGASYFLRVQHSGQCLSVFPSFDDGTPIVQWTCVGQSNQEWTLRPVSGGQPGEGDLSTADIVRFLEQATWGPTPELIEHVRQVGFEGFLNEQFDAPMSSYPTLPPVPTTRDNATCPNGSTCQRDNYTMYLLQNQFFRNALYGQDQLRQRVAFALHQIIVVSGVEINQPFWMAPYLQILDRNAFGNYRDLLYDITLNPAMGNYLDVTGNTRTRPERELRPRGPAAVLDRHVRAESRRHAAARRERPADPDLRPGRRSTTSRACSPAGCAPRRPARASRTTSTRWSPTRASTTSQQKTLLNGVVLPAGPEHHEGHERRDRQHRQRPEHRAVHFEAADPASGDEQPEPGLRRARRRGVQRRRHRRPRRSAGRSSARSCSIPRRAATSRPIRATAACAIRRSSSLNILRAFNARSRDRHGRERRRT